MSYPCQSKKFLHHALHFWRAKKDIESYVWYFITQNVWISPFCSNHQIHLPDPLSFWPILRRKCNYNTIMNMWLSMFLNSCWVQTEDWAWHVHIFLHIFHLSQMTLDDISATLWFIQTNTCTTALYLFIQDLVFGCISTSPFISNTLTLLFATQLYRDYKMCSGEEGTSYNFPGALVA